MIYTFYSSFLNEIRILKVPGTRPILGPPWFTLPRPWASRRLSDVPLCKIITRCTLSYGVSGFKKPLAL